MDARKTASKIKGDGTLGKFILELPTQNTS